MMPYDLTDPLVIGISCFGFNKRSDSDNFVDGKTELSTYTIELDEEEDEENTEVEETELTPPPPEAH